MHYHIESFSVFSEEDVFTEGCIPGTGSMYSYEQSFDAETKEHLIEKLLNHFSVEKDDIAFNACDEPGRIDICRMEDSEGCSVTESELSQWKEGKKKLFYVVYSGHLTKINGETW